MAQSFKWFDDPYQFESDQGFTVYRPVDQGQLRRCHDCLSQVATDGLRCENCAFSHNRRVKAKSFI